MPRAKGGPKTRQRRKKWLKLAKGYYGDKSKSYSVARQTVIKALSYAYRDRKARKRDFRRLWITRINAAARLHGITYSQLIRGLNLAQVDVNRKMLAELAVREPETFAHLVSLAQEQLKAA
jgi:large subunit ribosomal protein L20